MEIKRAIKKIFALGTGATMVGATVLGAMAAADLGNYPVPFVEGGVYNAVSVVGANAKAADSIGVADVLLGLSYVEGAAASTTTATTTLEGDTYKIAKGTDVLNLYEYLSSAAGGNGELENGPLSKITSSELNALADGSITNEKGTYTYAQKINLPTAAKVNYTIDSDQSDDPALYLWFPSTTTAYEYTLSFGSPLRSDIDDSSDFDDLDNKKISMLGKEYTIINTDNSTSGNTFELMAGSVQDTLTEGESKTYTINGIDYVTEVIIITDSQTTNVVKFKINGETTDALDASTNNIFKLADGTEIGVKEILPNEAGDVTQDLVEFYLGAEKVILADGSDTDNWGGTVTVGGTETDLDLDIVRTYLSSGTDVSITKIKVRWVTDTDYYVPVGGKLSDRLDADYKSDLFLENMDFEFTGVDFGETEEVKLSNSGDDKMKLTIPTLSGGDLSLYAFYSVSNGINLGLGKDTSHKLIINSSEAMSKNYQFIVNDDKSSHLVEVNKFKTGTENKTTFKDVGLGNTWTIVTNATGYGEFDVDGNTYSFVADYTASTVDMSSSSTAISAGIIWTASEAKITLSTNATGTLETGSLGTMVFTEYDGGPADNSSTAARRTITLSVDDKTGTTDDIRVSAIATTDPDYTGNGIQGWDSDDYFKDGYTRWGTHIQYHTPTDGQDYVVLTYPKAEATADVYLTSGVVSTAAGAGGEVGGLTHIDVASAVLDSEVPDWTAQNVIVVGGPCVNTVAAELMGSPADCAADFEEGKAKIKLFEDENVALLVAGYSADDTRRACTVLKNYKDYAADLVGSEVEMTATTNEDIVLAAPVVPEVVEPEVVEPEVVE